MTTRHPQSPLGASAVRAEHIWSGHDESTSNEGRRALVALEAVVVPMTLIERYKLGRSQTGDWLKTANALLGEELREAVSTVGLLFARGELLSDELLVASVTRETLSVPRSALVRDSALVDHSVTLDTSLCVLLLVAIDANCLLVTWYESFDANRLTTDLAAEAFLVKRLAFELVLFHTSAKDVGTSIAPHCKVVIMAVRTVRLLILGSKRLVHQ